MAGSFTELRVWKNGMTLSVEVYKVTKSFPKEEMYGLTSQLRRAAVSIPSNIAEGKGYKSNRDYLRFLYIARGSCLELQSELMIARELGQLAVETTQTLLQQANVVGRELNALIASLEQSASAKSAGA